MLGNLMYHFSIQISMILFILGLNSHSFVFRLSPQKVSYKLDGIYAHILESLLIPNRCGTL